MSFADLSTLVEENTKLLITMLDCFCICRVLFEHKIKALLAFAERLEWVDQKRTGLFSIEGLWKWHFKTPWLCTIFRLSMIIMGSFGYSALCDHPPD